jgi:DNA-binding GntR family transcriptional regulator
MRQTASMANAEIIPLSVGETVYQRIRDDIVFGRILPGQKLRLDRMKAAYGAGVGTLRETLCRLAAEGLILERSALEQSFAAGDMEWEGRVVAAHHKLERVEASLLAGARETALWKRYDGEFHQALISACGSGELMAAHAQAFDKYLRYLMIAFSFRGETAAREHRRLRDCALARDAAGALAVLEAHIGGCVAYTLETDLFPSE